MRKILKNLNKNLKIDEIDIKILEILKDNGRISDSEIARKINVSNDTVKRRRERMEKEGIIKIKALIDPKKFGYTHYIHAGITTKPPANINALIEKLKNIKGVYYIAISFGPSHNILVHFRGKKKEDLYDFVEWLRVQEEIQSLDVNTIYDVIKSGFRDLPLNDIISDKEWEQ
ncbi:MAG: Lrp/AsnC family transcriptional regulator [Thermoplasmata archaeon]